MTVKAPGLPSHFCILPWVHAYFNQSGAVYPCCSADPSSRYGSLKEKSFREIWNDGPARKLRKAMMAGAAPAECSRCYKSEELGVVSPRLAANEEYAKEFARVDQTRESGAFDAALPSYLEIRFSNICNLRCRICEPVFSTSWYGEAKEVLGIEPPRAVIRPTRCEEDLDALIADLLPGVTRLLFLGGEPLIQEGHYRLLERLIEEGRTGVELYYVTNFSRLSHRGKHALKLWNRFETVEVKMSLDGVGAQGELLRKGMRWRQIERNFKLMRLFSPRVRFEVYPAVSVMNCFHLPDAIDRWIELGMLHERSQFTLNIVDGPAFFSAQILDREERSRLEKRYRDYLVSLRSRAGKPLFERIEKELLRILEWLRLQPSLEAERPRFRKATMALDRLRGESFIELFPELENLRNPRSDP